MTHVNLTVVFAARKPPASAPCRVGLTGRKAPANGSGLGLTITKLLVQILGGDIELDSTVRQGGVFRMRLMLPSVPLTALCQTRCTASAVMKPLAASGFTVACKTILTVDDDPEPPALVDGFLSPMGLAIQRATRAGQALAMIEEISSDLTTQDIDLTGQDGWKLVQTLRSGALRATRIVMISGHAMEGRKRSAEIALYDAFLAEQGSLRNPRVARMNRLASVFDLPGIVDVLKKANHAASSLQKPLCCPSGG